MTARERLTNVLVEKRRPLFVMGGSLFLAALVYLFAFHPLKYNRSMEGFFPRSDPRLQLYLKNKEWFGGEGTLLVVYAADDLRSTAGMARQHELAERLRALAPEGVQGVNCLADSPVPRQPDKTFLTALTEGVLSPEQLQEQVRTTRLYDGVFYRADPPTTALVVQLRAQFASAEDAARCLENVRNEVESFQDLRAHVAGTLLMIHEVYQLTESDGRRLQVASVLLMGLVIAVFFRSLRWVLLPFLVIYAALYWAESLWGLLRGELTMVSSAISSLVAVLGVSTVVHFGMCYREMRRDGDPPAAMRGTFLLIGTPIFWVLLTTAGGFAALLICELKPVLDFAWLMLAATLLIGVATCVFLPLSILGGRDQVRVEVPGQRGMRGVLMATLGMTRRHPWLTLACVLIPGLVISLGVLRLEAQTDFTRNFRRSTRIYQAYDFIETRFGGAGQLDVVFNCPDLNTLSPKALQEYLDRLDQLERALAQLTDESGKPLPGVTKVLGLADFLDFFAASLQSFEGPVANLAAQTFSPAMRLQVLSGDVGEARQALANAHKQLDGLMGRLLPAPQRERLKGQVTAFERQLDKFAAHPPGPSFWNPDAGKMRVTLQVRERLPSADKHRLLAAARAKAAEVLGSEAQPQTTGVYVMLTHLIESLLNDQKTTFALALAIMFGMGILAFRSLRLALVALVPTVLPVVAIVGTMGWVGLPVNIATAMLASVAMGMTIDSSILYIHRYRQERTSGVDFDTALERTHVSTGLALVVANVALVLGFGVLAISDFIPLVHFGLLTALALFGGLAGNLVLLPLLLRLAK